MVAPKPTAAQAVALLYRRFPGPEWLPVHEVPLNGETGDGHHQGRAADFIALRLWGGCMQGMLQGFEVKVSRSDWLTELKAPDKRRPIEDACTATYLVAPRSVLVSLDELPDGWGWLEMRAKDLVLRKGATHKKKPYNPGLMFTLLKRFHDIGWYHRARRPMLVDFPKPLWTHLGQEVTPAQLREAARELFASEIRGLKQKADSKGYDVEVVHETQKKLRAVEDAITRATGLPRWQITNPADLEERLRAGYSLPSAKAIENLEHEVQRLEGQRDHSASLLKQRQCELASMKAKAFDVPSEEAS